MTDQQSKPRLDFWDFPLDKQASELHLELIKNQEELFLEIKRGENPRTLIDSMCDQILELVENDPWPLFRVIHEGKLFTHGIASVSVNSAIICAMAFPHLKNPKGNLRLFVRSVVLHDVGMAFLPQSILKKTGKFDEKERSQLEAHPSVSYEKLKSMGEPQEVCLTGLHHHEEWKGTGYPQNLVGDAIHPYARVLNTVLFLNALLSERSYRDSRVGYLAMKNIIQDTGVRFEPDSVKALVSTLGLYPPGSITLLTDGSVARVLETVFENPLRPKVRIMIDSEGTAFRNDTGVVLDLSKAKKLFIARPVNLQDLHEQLS